MPEINKINMENIYGKGLYQDGVFYFTNPGLYKMRTRGEDGRETGEETKDFAVLWNNKEYLFKEKTTTPLVIAMEPPESIQHIRKLFAKKYAQGWFHQTKKYRDLVKAGKNMPATYSDDIELGAVIQQCLTALPKGQAKVTQLPGESEEVYKGSKALKNGEDLNRAFADYEPPTLGKM